MPSLFRREALATQAERLHGEPLLAAPPRLRRLITAAALAALAVLAFGLWGQFTRKEHVTGYLAPTRGLIRIQTPQPGTVLEKHAVEGQSVRQGDPLLVIGSERAGLAGREAQAAALDELHRRRASLEGEQARQAQIDALAATALAERARGLDTEIAQARAQAELLRARVAGAQRTLGRHEQLVAARFVSEAALQQKQDELLDARAQLAALERSITALSRDLAAARSEQAAAGLRQDAHGAALARQISELDQQLAEGDARRAVVLAAPADGTVTTLLAEPGQAVQPGAPLLTLLPAGAELEAHLLVPTRAAGFIRPGQTVALRYQAFPYQRFGHHLGTVAQVGRSVLQPGDPGLPAALREPVYRVTVRLAEQTVRAYGQGMPLQAGMALDADVHIERRRLIEWVFDPVLSVTGRV